MGLPPAMGRIPGPALRSTFELGGDRWGGLTQPYRHKRVRLTGHIQGSGKVPLGELFDADLLSPSSIRTELDTSPNRG